MRLNVWLLISFSITFLTLKPLFADNTCTHSKNICSVRNSIVQVAGFDPVASAVRIGPRTLVTARHAIADYKSVTLTLRDGHRINASVIPNNYPGDLILLDSPDLYSASYLSTLPIIKLNLAKKHDTLRVVAIDIAKKQVKIFPHGLVFELPAKDQPLARLHHTAYSQPGTSGGALINNLGELVGIVASGGQGRYEAVPSSQIEQLRWHSGLSYEKINQEIGEAIRHCTIMVERTQNRSVSQLNDIQATKIKNLCTQTSNRQFYDLAASTLGRLGFLSYSIELFEKALGEDKNAINSRIGLIISLTLSKQYKNSIPHIKWLLKRGVSDGQIIRFGIQSGVWGGDKNLTMQAFSLLKKTNPSLVPIAKKFIENPPPKPTR